MSLVSSKTCCGCHEQKELSEFYKNKTRKDGHDAYCKDCRRLIKKKHYDKNSKSINKKHYQWFKSLSDEKKQVYRDSARERQKLYRPKRTATEAARRFRKNKATPDWLTTEQESEIENTYWLAKDLKSVSGQEYHVDHIVPLKHPNICGLHVPWNLQVLPADVNISKSNRMGEYSNEYSR